MAKVAIDPECQAAHTQKDKERKRHDRGKNKKQKNRKREKNVTRDKVEWLKKRNKIKPHHTPTIQPTYILYQVRSGQVRVFNMHIQSKLL